MRGRRGLGLVGKVFPRKSPAVIPGVRRDQAAATSASDRSKTSSKVHDGFRALRKKKVVELNYCHLSSAESRATHRWRRINRLGALLRVRKIVLTPYLSSH